MRTSRSTSRASLPLSVLLALGCHSEADAKKPAPPSKGAPPSETAPATTATASPGSGSGSGSSALGEALAKCTPGSPIKDCAAAVKAAHLKTKPLRADLPDLPDFGIDLAAPYDSVFFTTKDASNGRIVLADFRLVLPPGKDRKDLLDVLKQATAAAPGSPGSSEMNAQPVDCGADNGGPAWAPAGSEDPEVQYAIETHPGLSSWKGKKMDDYVVKTKTDALHVCFLLPPAHGAFAEKTRLAAAAMTAFLHSPPFTEKALPK